MAVLLITHDLGRRRRDGRRGRRDVRRRSRGRGPGARPVRAPAAPVHARAARCDAAPWRRRASASRPFPARPSPQPTGPPGCRFRDRCAYAWERCERERPEPDPVARSARRTRCHLAARAARRAAATTRGARMPALTAPPAGGAPLLEVRDLTKHFPIARRTCCRAPRYVRAVDGVSFDITPARRSAWSANRAAARPPPGARILRLIEPTSGSVRFEGQRRLALSAARDAARACAGTCRSSFRTRSRRSTRA